MSDLDPTKNREAIIERNARNDRLVHASTEFFEQSVDAKYSYLFDWLGRPAIQYPQDIVALQEIVWTTKPDLIIETGIAHGGSLLLSASLLTLLDVADKRDPRTSNRSVLGVDIDIRVHNRRAIEDHPMSFKITMIEGSSVDPEVGLQVRKFADDFERIMVILDSNHTHDHVLEELRLYAPLVSIGQYCIVYDTVIERLPDGLYNDRPWSRGNNPMTAVSVFLEKEGSFTVDKRIEQKLLFTVAPNGFLFRHS